MKNTILIFGLVLLIGMPSLIKAQTCNNFQNKYCKPDDNGLFEYDGQSRSALFKQGETSTFKIIAYMGQDYSISICSDPILGKIHLRILEDKEVKEKKIDTVQVMEDQMITCTQCNGTGKYEGGVCPNCGGTGKVPSGNRIPVKKIDTSYVSVKKKVVLYDNANKKYATHIEFSMTSTKGLYIEISTAKNKDTGGMSFGNGDMGCVGVLIQHMATPKIGFK